MSDQSAPRPAKSDAPSPARVAALLAEYEEVNAYIRAAYDGSFKFTNLILLLQGGLGTALALLYEKENLLGHPINMVILIIDKPVLVGACMVGFLSALLAYRTARRYLIYVSTFAGRGIEIERELGLHNLRTLKSVWDEGATSAGSAPIAGILAMFLSVLWIWIILMHVSF